PRVEQQLRGALRDRVRQRRLDPEHLPERYARVDVLRGVLVAVELDCPEADRGDRPADLLGARADEDAHAQDTRGEALDDLRRAADRDVALAPGPEVEAQSVSACLEAHLRVLEAGDAAHLHPRSHAASTSSRTAATGSAARIRLSPTSAAPAPARARRLT